MKRLIPLMCLLLILLTLSGCAADAPKDAPAPPVSDQAPLPEVDLSRLSDTMAYAEFFNIATNPDGYRGKTMLIKGIYQTLYAKSLDETLHWLVLADQAACCSVSLTLELPEGSGLQYPEDGARMELLGVIDYFVVGDQPYPKLLVQAINPL